MSPYYKNHQKPSNGMYVKPQTVTIFAEIADKIEFEVPVELLSTLSSDDDDDDPFDDDLSDSDEDEMYNSKRVKDWIFKNHYDQICDMISIKPYKKKSQLEKANRRLLLLDKVTQAQRGYMQQQKVRSRMVLVMLFFLVQTISNVFVQKFPQSSIKTL